MKTSLRTKAGIAFLAAVLSSGSYFSSSFNRTISRTIDINRFSSGYELKQTVLGYYGKRLEKDIYYKDQLLLSKGKLITREKFNRIVNFYNNTRNIYVDSQGRHYRNIPGVNSYSKIQEKANNEYYNKWNNLKQTINYHRRYKYAA